MLVIFGYGHKTNKTDELRQISHCFNCGNDRRWILGKQSTWFTLFFIPVVPVKNEYLEYCPVCGKGNRLSAVEYQNKLNQIV
ncbi:MAG: zinc-ribbon domain-containing protein [Bacteroidales bacterium]|nr:zinc-ribbon domain-containing protein [Bacteroidales bacterium]